MLPDQIFIIISHHASRINKCIVNMDSNDELKIDIKTLRCHYFDDIILIIYFNG